MPLSTRPASRNFLASSVASARARCDASKETSATVKPMQRRARNPFIVTESPAEPATLEACAPSPARCSLLAGCVEQYEFKRRRATRFDAVIVPGCPSEEDGVALAVPDEPRRWAAILWERGLARYFITSGAAVHSRYVEAEAIAAGMAALGVPADRI